MIRFVKLRPASTRVEAFIGDAWRSGTIRESGKNQCDSGYHYYVDLDRSMHLYIPVRLGVTSVTRCKLVVVDEQHIQGEAE